ncbi:hypothetical protein Kpol_543p52 [Vanderwaltozyma polyspora DSM 70294]|uniref:tRNA-splicing endonuclease subunit Sen2 n=1 Tax=Vanderwaltozyma polyspora (strain ATCC 22028 / DSM 70294 / BCRC 21397 / CBS 2163 / NBRC 10782 / NRRL Y-8283 / UCD 57-17) TaxID=436907 RepID=A7THQ6_VANPO|nr:uncharacterized protein Kpol_543p52 [Vanderwaltozyma polyspora DSM 70294]EDO18222.1 hypothetical protein Kpol_543p52 [Vanderwaltozyma polyspora DSM 70294]
MAKGRPNSKRYKYPLPIHPIDDLPQLYPHNPISWIYWTYCYVKKVNALERKIKVELTGKKYVHILVKDNNDMLYLWENGFFGTGQFSRSEPTWLNRATNRLLPNDEDKKNQVALEKVTQIRRSQRAEFKKEREKMEAQLLELRKQGCTAEEEQEFIEKERETLRELRSKELLLSSIDNELKFRYEDNELFDDMGNIIQLESLELLPVEAIFLTFALPVLEIETDHLFRRLAGDPKNVNYKDIYGLIKKYVAYHHYRSHGWCVRSGIKFGCDYILYQRGPPFHHAEFCVMVLDSEEKHDYTWFSSIARVVGGVKKTFVLCYIERLISEQDILKLWRNGQYHKVFSSFKTSEIIYKRWISGKNRD